MSDIRIRTIFLLCSLGFLKIASASGLFLNHLTLTDQQYEQLKGVNQIYMSPAGKNSGSCSRARPCKTFDYAVAEMNAGDALILLPGKYTLEQNGALSATTANGRPIRYSAQLPSGLNADKPTIARAEMPGTVEIEGSFTLGNKVEKVKYIIIYGLTFLSPSNLRNSDYSVVKNTGIRGSLGIGTNDHSQGCMYNLVEDVWIWGKNERGNAVNYRAHHNIWRRVIVRDDGCDLPYCGEGRGNYSVGMTVYNSHDVIVENVIIFDRILGGNPHGYADFATAQHDSRRDPQPEGEANGGNKWLGCMSINSEDTAINFEADEVLDFPNLTVSLKDFVALKTRHGLSMDGAHRPYKGYSLIEIDNVHLYTTQGGQYYIGCDVVNRSADKGCAHRISGVNKGSYKPGMASILPKYRYGTKISLWPWNNEDRIKSDLCKNDESPRGFCLFNGSFSEYIRSF